MDDRPRRAGNPATALPAIEFVLDGDRELRAIERDLAATEGAAAVDPEGSGEALALLHHRFERSAATPRARARQRCSPAWASLRRDTAIRSRVFPGAGGCASISRRH